MGLDPARLRIAHVYERGAPEPDALAGVVVTGSSAMVSHRAPWSERTAIWLAGAVRWGRPCSASAMGTSCSRMVWAVAWGATRAGAEIGSVESR
jgi:GMP synthase (glutamine-hydrolysing)